MHTVLVPTGFMKGVFKPVLLASKDQPVIFSQQLSLFPCNPCLNCTFTFNEIEYYREKIIYFINSIQYVNYIM